MDGLLKDIEHYKSLQGELTIIQLVEEAIRDFYMCRKSDDCTYH